MKLRKFGALGAAVVILAALIGILAPTASAAAPPWEPDGNAVGTITFYDASGNVVTSGNDLSAMWSYAEGSTTTFSGANVTDQFTKAQIEYSWPDHSNPTANWFTKAPYASTSFPVTAAGTPANISSSTKAMVNSSGTGQSSNFAGIASSGTNDATTGYNNMIQVRLIALGPGGATTAPNYWDTDISVNVAANTWSQVYPTPAAVATPTTTAVPTATPSSPQADGTSVTFHVTVAPSTAAGTVQFQSDGSNLGTAQPLTSGAASVTTSALAPGTHSITAIFTPTDPTAFAGSSSTSALSYTITSPATPTATTLTANPSGPITVGPTTTLTATIAPAAAGTVQFKDGATNLGSPVSVAAGSATSAAQSFGVGTHSLSAVFTSSDSGFNGSTGNLSYVVNPVPATSTTTTFNVTQSSPQTFGTTLNFNATVSPNTAVGTVHFFDGTTDVGSAGVSGGSATTAVSTLGAGTHNLTAQFMPDVPANFGASTSSPATSFTINAAASTVSLGASPSTSAQFGQAVTITATVGPVGVGGGSVQFKYLPGDVVIGSSPVSGTTAQIVTSILPVTTTGIEAIFTPSSANYSASPNESIDYGITPGDTALALSVTPSGGQAASGTQETLTAAITPSSAAGSVQFFDGASMIGAGPVTVSGGTASLPITLADGAHTLTAMFVTSDPASFNSSPTSNQVLFTVLPPATATATTLAITPGTTEPFGTDLTFTATVTPSAAGTVTFKEGTTVLGSAPTTAGADSATAAFSTVGLAGGAHSVVATFTPTAPLSFVGSSSDPGSVTITAISTSTSLGVAPAGPVEHGTTVMLTATVTPSAAVGAVTFFNGATIVGTAPVVAGVSTLVTKALASGDAMLTATFNGTNPNNYTTSSSTAVSLTVVAPPVVGTVYDNGKPIGAGSKVTVGSTLQVHASGFQPGESVKIYIHSSPILVATVHASATGDVIANIVIPSDLTLGKHTIELVGGLGTVSFAFTAVSAAGGGTTGGSSSGGGLANTGVNVKYGFIVGLLLLAAGGMFIGGVRFGPRRTTE